MTKDAAPRPFSLAELHPKMMAPITEMLTACRAHVFTVDGTSYIFEAFEGLRLPERQYHLFARTKNTKAGPWQSSHQYGLAVDFACRAIDQMGRASGWHWPEQADWDWLKRQARRNGLDIPIKWDRGHVEHPLWRTIRGHVI